MAEIFVEGLGNVQISGQTPTKEEEQAIIEQLQSTEDSLATDTAIPEMITPSLADERKPQGLEIIGGRPTFEAAGAITGSVVGGAALNPVTSVAGGTLASMGAGQLYDVLQGAITDEETNFGTQIEKAKTDLQRELLLQSFFQKLPGLGTKIKASIFGKPNKQLYDSAKRLNYPLSLSDAGNMISKGYGRVIGVFPYVGQPIKKTMAGKADILNKTADETLDLFAPNVALTKLGIDMTEASKSTFGDFKRVTGFLYDDFFQTASKVRQPIISTKTFKNSLQNYVNLIDDGTIKIKGKKLKSPQKDAIYQYAKSAQNMDDFINVNQYKALVKDIKTFAKQSQKEGYNIKVLTGFKGALEKDLAELSKQKYLNNLVKNGVIKNPNLASEIGTKLKFANKVYANGLENSLVVKTATGEKKKLTPTVGISAFQTPTAKKFMMVDKNIFGAGFQQPGSITADQLGNVLLANRNVSPQLLDDLRNLVGKKQFDRFVRARIQQGFDKSLVLSKEGGVNGLIFDPFKFEDALGLNTSSGRDLIKAMLKDSKLSIEKLDDFFAIAKNHAGLQIPDVSNFVARRATLGGTKSLFGGFAMGYSTYKEPFKGLAMIYFARRGSGFLSNPKQLDDVMTVLDPNSTASKVKIASLKLVDGLISDSSNKIEENGFREYKEFIELTPIDEIKKNLGLEN